MPRDSSSLPVGHAWHPIEELPDDWEELADRDLGRLAEIWDERRDEMVAEGALREFNERLRREWAIETGLIERIYTLDRGTTEILLARGLKASLISASSTNRDPELVGDILQDHAAALDGLFEFVKGQRELSTSFVKELHAQLLANQETASARDTFGRRVEMPLERGAWKERPNSPVRPDGRVHEYCPPEQVASEMDRLVEMHLRHGGQAIPPEVEAAWLHHRFVQIHPFQDGNGRVARALATLVTIRAGWFPLTVPDARRDEYIEALEAADQLDLGPLVRLFADTQVRAIYRALGRAETAIADRRHLTAVIQSAVDKLDRRRARLEGEWDNASSIGRVLGDDAATHLRSVADELRSSLGARLGSESAFFVTVGGDDDSTRRSWNHHQVVATANEMDAPYFANIRDFHTWAKLLLHADNHHELLVSIHAMGQEFSGLLAASASLAAKEPIGDGGGMAVADVRPVVQRPFQVTYREELADVRARFARWIGDVVVDGLAAWQQEI